MTDLLPFIVVGVTTGSLYGLTGLGLVLTYRTSGVFNFAHGAMAAAGAYLFYELHVVHGIPWPVATAVTMALLGVVGGVATERLARSLVDSRISTVIVATVGLMLAVQGFLFIRFGTGLRQFHDFLPTTGITVSGVNVSYAQMITVGIASVAAAGLYLFLRRSRLGQDMRAVVDAPELLSLTGTNPSRVRTVSWIIGTSFAALSGILIAPVTGLDAVILTLLVVHAFGAVAIGRFSNLPLTYAGGIGIGVAASLATKVWGARPPLNGLPTSIPFLVLLAVLMATPTRRFPVSLGRPGGAIRMRALEDVPVAWRVGAPLAVLAGAVAVPSLVGSRLFVYSTVLCFVVVLMSLALLLYTSGQISLAHASFMAMGATTFSALTAHGRVPWLPALLLTGVLVVPVGALLAVPAIRLSGVYLALATFGFGILVQNVIFNTSLMFGSKNFVTAHRPVLGGIDGHDDKVFYFVVLAVVVTVAVGLLALIRSRLGRLLRALGDSPTALTTQGLNVHVTRVLVFCLSAFLAAIGGGLFISQFGQVSRDSGFGPLQSIMWVAVLTLCGTRVVRSSVLAAFVLVALPSYVTGLSQEWQTFLFGLGAVMAAVLADGRVPWGALGRRLADNSQHRRARSPVAGRRRTAPAEAMASAG